MLYARLLVFIVGVWSVWATISSQSCRAQSLQSQIVRLQGTSTELRGKFSDWKSAEAVLGRLPRCISALQQIERGRQQAAEGVITVVSKQSDLLNEQALSLKGPDDRPAIKRFEQSSESYARGWASLGRDLQSKQNGKLPVEARTSILANAVLTETSGYNVFYLDEGTWAVHQHDQKAIDMLKNPFNKPSSPTDTRELIIGDYVMWAEQEGVRKSGFEPKRILRSAVDNPLPVVLIVHP